jgi:hypothetical protein
MSAHSIGRPLSRQAADVMRSQGKMEEIANRSMKTVIAWGVVRSLVKRVDSAYRLELPWAVASNCH